MLAEAAEQRREVKKAWLAQHAELARPRPVDRRAPLDGDHDRARGGKAWVIPLYQYIPPYDEYEDMGYVEPIEIKAIVLPALPPNVKFGITSVIIQLLNLEGVFFGLEKYDPNMHLANLTGIYTSYTMLGVDQKAFRLRLFPFLLIEEASLWMGEIPRGSITTWN